MAITAPVREKRTSKMEIEELRRLEPLEVIEVTRAWMAAHPSPRTWSGLLAASQTDDAVSAEVVAKRTTWGDLSMTNAWNYVDGHPLAPPKNRAWFRQGRDDHALLYQQGWRTGDPE